MILVKKNLYELLFGALLFLAATLALTHLGEKPLWDYDEATYAQVTSEMLQSNDVVTLTYRHEHFFEKPPLYIWLASLAGRAFGESEFSMRLPSALAYIALVAVTVLLVLELSHDRAAALLSGAILLTTSSLLEPARQMRFDVLVTLWVVLAAYAFVRGLHTEKWLLLFGISVGLAVLTKSVIGVFALTAGPVCAVWFGHYTWIKNKYFWIGVGSGLLVALPWHIVESLRFGQSFWQEYIRYTVGQRFTLELFNAHSATNRDYIWFMVNFAAPWTQIFVLGLVPLLLYWQDIPSRHRAGIGASIIMVLLVIGVFFTAATKAPTYLVPAYPFAAIAISLALAALVRQLPRTAQYDAGAFVFVLLGLGLTLSVYNGFHKNPYYFQTDELSQEEKSVGLLVKVHPQSTWYAFNNYRELGSAMYYAQNTNPIMLTSATPLAVGDIVLLYQSQQQAFLKEHAKVSTVAQFNGKQLLLLEVVSDN